MSNVFEKIIRREIPAKIIYEDELVMAFEDINPMAPVHCLLIPKESITSLDSLKPEHTSIMAHLLLQIPTIARLLHLEKDGYRVISNVGEHGGQTVSHLHFHIIGGRLLDWNPG